jgi:hypothetical protein
MTIRFIEFCSTFPTLPARRRKASLGLTRFFRSGNIAIGKQQNVDEVLCIELGSSLFRGARLPLILSSLLAEKIFRYFLGLFSK